MSSREEKDQKSRVFVGNLGPEVTVEDIRQRFEVHGPISNVNKNVKGFAFVQYENEPDAKEAVAKEDGRLFKGKKIDVKPAMRSGEAGGGPQNRPGDAKSGRGPGIVDRRGGSRDRDDRFGPSGGDRGYGGGGGRDFGGSGWGGGGGGGERDFRHGGGGYPPYDGPGRGGRDGYYGGGSDNGGGGYRGGFNEGPPGRGGGMMGPRGGPAPPPSLMDKPNDVEIICMNKHTRVYAEAVEARLKNMGLTVDVLFPNPEIPLGKVLGNIAGRGVMYAVCVSPDNELHRSLTVNVLQGEQQEHRNMPLDEAMSFVGKSFSRFIEKPAGGQLGYATPAAAAASSAADQLPAFGHPNDIRTILGFLIDDRPMSIMEYDKLIKYLATRREGTLKAEYGMNIPAHLLLPPVGPMQDPVLKAKQEEIQNKVMEILSRPRKTAANLPAAPAAAPAVVTGSGGLTALNPTLQQAIDSLVKTGPNLLSSLTKAGSSSVGSGADSSAPGGESGNLGGYYSALFGGGGSGGAASGAGGSAADSTLAGAFK